jgi:hypothetical protein
MELPEAYEQLVKIFGPGSEALTSKLLDDLAVDPSGDSRAPWDTAIGEAVNQLRELKSGEIGKHNFPLFFFKPSLIISLGSREISSSLQDSAMDVEGGGGPSSTTEDPEQAQLQAINDYKNQNSLLLV